MLKARKKSISVVLVLTMLATMLFAFAGTAMAAATYSTVGTPPQVAAGVGRNLAAIKAEIGAGDLAVGNVVTIRLPGDFAFPAATPTVTIGGPAPGAVPGTVVLWAPVMVGTENNALGGLAPGSITPARLSDTEISFTLNSTPNQTLKSFFYLYLNGITVPAGFEGDIKATISSNAGFGSGEVVVGQVGRGSVSVTSNKPLFTDTANLTLRITENMAGAMAAGTRSVSLRLPNGFEWAAAPAPAFGAIVWGDAAFIPAPAIRFGDTRILDLNAPAAPSTAATAFTVTATVRVVDPTIARAGDVEVAVTGNSNISTGAIVVGTYGDFGIDISAVSTPDVYAGQLGQEIGDVVISEKVPGSLAASAAGRSILLTLPANAKWGSVDTIPTVQGGLVVAYTGFVGTDARTIRYDVTTASTTQAGKITLDNMEVVLAADAKDDLVITVSGTAGASGEVVVAKVKAPVAAAGEKKDVKIGVQGQEAGNITITETVKGLLNTGEDITLTVPQGARFAGTPAVSVKDGNVSIDMRNVRTTNDGRSLTVPIRADSSVASTIEVTGIKYTVDRTYPEGDLSVGIGGGAVNEVNDNSQITNYWGVGLGLGVDIDGIGGIDFTIPAEGIFPGAGRVASVVNANCITPAPPVPGEVVTTATFTIGSTSYNVGEASQTMDVAPFMENGRAYVPIRYVAYAVGVSEDNIMWDGATSTATLIKGDRVVQLTINSNKMLINGATITMDVPAKMVSGRTMLPVRWVGNALGCQVNWDDATQTVTVTQ